MATTPLLVVILWRKTLLFGDETLSRRRFCAGNFFFWRRDPFSSSFLRRKTSFFGDETRSRRRFVPETPLFGDDTLSRRRFVPETSTFWRRDPFSSSFCAGNSTFWRRHPFSSSFLCGNLHFLATRPLLVVALRRKTHFFGDEITSRRHFWVGNSIFWRRDPFSSSFLRRNLHFLVTTPVLVVAFGRRTHFFGDETLSRRLFGTGNAIFWRRDSFSSSFLDGKPTCLATTPFLVAFLGPETLFFGDETHSRRRFWTENPLFWRRDPFSSPFWDRKRYFLATTLILVAFFAPEPPLFWRRHPFSSSF
ncbi:hypothetical protein NST17_16795 [Caldifermentibacillus hisashii]|uniref:Uncharacterized protein n=1 Tax=Caldifermentibacillus hisashii TaxID=996558 RepID=A0ABU9K2K7_9BACI